MNPVESQMYNLGKQAYQDGYQRSACNVREARKKCWWLAGWHDADIEYQKTNKALYIEFERE